MNRGKLIEAIQSPESIGALSLEILHQLKREHPYSSTLQMLYTKALHAEKSIYYEEQLRAAALVVTDRRKLYQLILQTPLQQHIQSFEEEVARPQETTEETAKDANQNKAFAPPQVIQPETKKEAAPTVTNESIAVPPTEAVKKEQQLDPLEQGILLEAINSSIHSEILEYEVVEKEDSKPPLAITEENPETIPDEVEEATEKSSFTNREYDFNIWLNPQENQQPKQEEENSQPGKIIDQFIAQKETGVVQKNFFSAANLAKLSLVDKEDFVSETLAKIYADQGNYDKAIRAYEVLRLKFPEKSTFFANQIKILKEKLEG